MQILGQNSNFFCDTPIPLKFCTCTHHRIATNSLISKSIFHFTSIHKLLLISIFEDAFNYKYCNFLIPFEI